jgi:hypothetical protein
MLDKAKDFLGRRDVAFAVGLGAILLAWSFMMDGLDIE